MNLKDNCFQFSTIKRGFRNRFLFIFHQKFQNFQKSLVLVPSKLIHCAHLKPQLIRETKLKFLETLESFLSNEFDQKKIMNLLGFTKRWKETFDDIMFLG